MYVYPEDVDRRLNWKPGRAERLAKQRRLPHYVLPDGSIRFVWDEIERLTVQIPAVTQGSPIRAEEAAS